MWLSRITNIRKREAGEILGSERAAGEDAGSEDNRVV